MTELRTLLFAIAAAATLGVVSARAADCGDSAVGFNEWLDSFKKVAVRDGVSPQVADAALSGVVYDPSVSAHDRGQGFGQNFAAFAARHITPGRIKRGKMMLLAYAEPFEKIEQRYGVPAPVLVAIWGLETDFGAGLGGYPTFSALATLAYDCRRAQIYRAELIDALMIVQRGLLRPDLLRPTAPLPTRRPPRSPRRRCSTPPRSTCVRLSCRPIRPSRPAPSWAPTRRERCPVPR